MRPSSMKLTFLFFIFVFFASCAIVRLVDLQILKHEKYCHIASKMHISTREIPAVRGKIYDRNLRLLVTTLPSYLIWADPEFVKDPQRSAKVLADVLDVDFRSTSAMLADTSSRYHVIYRFADRSQIEALEELKPRGVYWDQIGKRTHTMGEIAKNVVGAVSVDGKGISGIEFTYNEILAGKPGKKVYVRDARGKVRPSVTSVIREPMPGKSIVLTIDADLQYHTELALAEAIQSNKAKAGGAVVVNPYTGDILAMASYPSQPNYPVEVVFEPGSSIKFCTYSIVLEENKVDTSEVFYTNGGILNVPGPDIHDDHPHEFFTFSEAFVHSSNVVAAVLSSRIEPRIYYRYLSSLGFGLMTGIQLPGEANGLLKSPEDWSGRTIYTIAFGQEIGVTAIQLTMALAAVVNGGNLMRPRLVKGIADDAGNLCEEFPPRLVRKAISEETSKKMKKLMQAVVDRGTGQPAGIEGFPIGGKTGTSQKFVDGRYAKGKNCAVFGGFVPVENPKYVVVVVIDEPSAGVVYGGPVAGPVFREIVSYALRRDKFVVPIPENRLAEIPTEQLDREIAMRDQKSLGLASSDSQIEDEKKPILGLLVSRLSGASDLQETVEEDFVASNRQ